MKRFLILLFAVVLVAPVLSVVSAVVAPERAQAANAALFNPGYIISDAMFYDGGAMSGPAIQDFLQQRVPTCVAGYTCLRDYRQNTPTMAPSALCPGGYTGAVNQRASTIIANVGAGCNISQKTLLVLLEKEQGLVSATSPSAGKFNAATGFSCPDTAPCDPSFAGFFYQVYYAARQFQKYAQNPTSWNYQAGRVNSILYSPKTTRCPNPTRGDVYIQNKATAGLYIYTPYQPNAAAMANLYGTGDGCSTYGNRNFWRIFSDWFGNPTIGSSLLRSPGNGTVYLISGDDKYPIPSIAILTSLAPLGVVGYVSQAYLDAFTTRHLVGHSIRSPDGTIYFYDSGIKLPYTSCTQAADYGASCDSEGYVQLTEAQSAAFRTGPALTSVLGTVEGSRYYIKGGKKAEILDAASQAAAGIPAGMNVLTENAVAHLPLAAPIVRDDVFVLTRGTKAYSLLAGSMRYPVATGSEAALGVSTRVAGTLSKASIALLTAGPSTFSGAVQTAPGAPVSVLASGGRYDVTAGGFTSTPVTVGQAFIDSYGVAGTIGPASFLKSPSNGTVYIVMPTDIRPISGWGALLALTPAGDPVIITVAQSLIDQFRTGPVALTAGTFVRSRDNATVYLVNGVTDRIAFSSFVYPQEAGFDVLTFSTEERIQAYPLNPQIMTFGFLCGTDYYVAAGGSMHLVSADLRASYPFTPSDLDQFTCRQMKIGAPASSFIRTTDGSIYQIVGGEKRPVGSMTRFNQISNGQSWLTVHPKFAAAYPTGAPA